jgi:peptidoglycan/LPS O-acetylase OafA/YrhL
MPATTLGAMLAQDRNSFGLVRLAAAVAVVISHAFVLASGNRTAEPFIGWTGFKLGDLAVFAFFVISGIVTAASLERSRSASAFVIARALRIWPVVIVFALVFALLLAPLLTTAATPAAPFSKDTLLYILRVISFAPGNSALPGVFDNNPLPSVINEPLWTVKYELICYVVLVVAAAILKPAGRRGYGLAVLAIIAIYLLTIPFKLPDGTLGHLRQFAFCYALGLGAYLIADRLEISINGLLASIALYIWTYGSPLQPLATTLLVGYGAVWLSAFSFGPLRAAANRTDLSYGIYVLGWPVGQMLLDGWPGLSAAALAGLNLVFVAPLALLSWHLVEKPSMGLKRYLVWQAPPKDGRPETAPVAVRRYARPLVPGRM